MKSLEVELNETLSKLTATGTNRFYEQVKLAKSEKNTQLLPIGEQLQIAKNIAATVVRKNNGAYSESIGESTMTTLQERQVECFKKQGHDEVTAKFMAGVYDRELRVAMSEGKSAAQFVESLKK